MPKEYSWKQDGSDPTKFPESEVTSYHAPISIAKPIVVENEEPKGYFDRIWPGSIIVSGKVPFTRVDALADFWKTANNSAAYAVVFEDKVPDNYFIWSLDQTYLYSERLGWTLTYSDDDDKSMYNNYEKYTIDDQGFVHLWDIYGNEIPSPPNDHFNLNNGEFIRFYLNEYWGEEVYKPGTPVAGKPEGTVTIDPAVWTLNFENKSYYIPENIQTDEDKQTKLRIKLSVATASAEFTEKEVQDLIDSFLKDNPGYVGDLVQDEGTLYVANDKAGKDNIGKFLWVKGEFYQHSVDKNAYAIRYGGLKREFRGETDVTDKKGGYQSIVGDDVQIVTIEIPLTNDEYENISNSENLSWEYDSAPEDHNIYRGREYHVKLYVTKQGAWNNQTNTASRTINIGGEELTITGKVVTKPMK